MHVSNRVILLTFALLFLNTTVTGDIRADDRTNIIYLMADDLGYGDFNPQYMPRSHKIMEDLGTSIPLYSMQNCAPSRTALMTGKLPSLLGITGVDSPPAYNGIDVNETMLSELLSGAGYSTGVFGKWHLGLNTDQSPLNNGFDEFVGFSHGWINYYGPNKNGIEYPDGTIGHDHHGAHDFQYNGVPIYTESYSTFAFRNAAIEFIERNAEDEKPFFAYVPFNAPHGPHAAPRRYVEMYQQTFGINDAQISLLYEYTDTVLAVPKVHNINLGLEARLNELLFYASIRAMDDAIADIFQTVVDNGELDNTLFLFASDNGAGVGNISRHGDNGPLRGGKGTPYEGGHRVANFLVWNGVVNPNHNVGINIWMGDLYETFVSIAGINLPSTSIESNNVITPLLTGATSFIRKHGGQHIVSHISKSFVGSNVQAIWAMNNANQKYIRFVEFESNTSQISTIREELYDLGTDIAESNNLIADPRYTNLLARMRRKFESYGGDSMLQGLPVVQQVGWAGYSLPQEWGFPGRLFFETDIQRSNLF